jgi:hypothetical protein
LSGPIDAEEVFKSYEEYEDTKWRLRINPLI